MWLEYARMFWPGLVAGVAVAITCAALSPLVVLRRLSFMGQGVSHAAFGGIGLALVLGLSGAGALAMVAAFCVLTALGIAWVTDRRTSSADTVIGIFLVATMALGAALVTLHVRTHGAGGSTPAWEDLLFGSLVSVSATDALAAWVVCAATLGLLAWFRRPMLFWAFDEPASEAFGAPAQGMKFLLMALLAIAVVAAMKVAGVVLATALLVLPGATALRVSDRIGAVMALTMVVSVTGVIGGAAASFALDLPPGACVVGALVAMFAATGIVGARR